MTDGAVKTEDADRTKKRLTGKKRPKWFILTLAIYAVLLVGTFVYCYIRLHGFDSIFFFLSAGALIDLDPGVLACIA